MDVGGVFTYENQVSRRLPESVHLNPRPPTARLLIRWSSVRVTQGPPTPPSCPRAASTNDAALGATSVPDSGAIRCHRGTLRPPANPRRSSWCHLVPLGLVVPSLVPLSSSFQMAPAASAGGARRAGPGADQRRHHLARVRAPPHHPGVHRATHRARVHRDRAARLRGPATVQECSMSKQRALVTVPAASAAKSCARSRRAEPRCSPATSTSRRSTCSPRRSPEWRSWSATSRGARTSSSWSTGRTRRET
jgi:hypothetical protein